MKRKWYENLLIAIGKLICFFRGHDWVKVTTGRYCKCCGKTEQHDCCLNCFHFHYKTLWCRKNKSHVRKQPSVCDLYLNRLGNINKNNHG